VANGISFSERNLIEWKQNDATPAATPSRSLISPETKIEKTASVFIAIHAIGPRPELSESDQNRTRNGEACALQMHGRGATDCGKRRNGQNFFARRPRVTA